MFRSTTTLGCSLWLVFAAPLPAADLTAEDIVRSAIAGEKHQESLRQHYIYREHQENRLLKPDGTPGRLYINRDFEHIFLEGGFYRRLVAVDGKPLKPRQAREEEEKMRMTAAQRKAAGLNKKAPRTLISGVPLADIVDMMDHKILREEEFAGLNCWVVQSEPKRNAVPKTPNQTRAPRLQLRSVDCPDRQIHPSQRMESHRRRAGYATRLQRETGFHRKSRWRVITAGIYLEFTTIQGKRRCISANPGLFRLPPLRLPKHRAVRPPAVR